MLKSHLPWIIPLLLYVLVGGFQLYGLIDRVHALEENSRTRGENAIHQLQIIDSRVNRLEEFCCGEVKEYQIYIEEKTHVMDNNN